MLLNLRNAAAFLAIVGFVSAPTFAANPRITGLRILTHPAQPGVPVTIQILHSGPACGYKIDKGLGQAEGPFGLQGRLATTQATFSGPGSYTIKVWGKKKGSLPPCQSRNSSAVVTVTAASPISGAPNNASSEGRPTLEMAPPTAPRIKQRKPTSLQRVPKATPRPTAPGTRTLLKIDPVGARQGLGNRTPPRPPAVTGVADTMNAVQKSRVPCSALPTVATVPQPSPPSGDSTRFTAVQRQYGNLTLQGPGATGKMVPLGLTMTEVMNAQGAIGETVSLRGSLRLTDGTPVPNQEVRFRVAGVDAGKAKTNPLGEARTTFKVPSNLGTGQKSIQTSFAGNTACKPSKGEGTLRFAKAPVSLTLQTGNPPQQGTNIYLKGRLVRSTDQAAISGRAVSIELNGVAMAAQATGSGGGFSLQYLLPKNFPTYGSAKARFDGDVLYLADSALHKFKTLPARVPATIACESQEGELGQTVELVATMKMQSPAPGGHGLGGREVRFVMERGSRFAAPNVDPIQLGAATTDDRGVARLAYHIDIANRLRGSAALPLAFELRAHISAGDELSVETASDAKLRVNKAGAELRVTGPRSARLGEPIELVASLRRSTDDEPVDNAMLFGPGGNATTNEAGKATFSFTPRASGGLGAKTFEIQLADDPFHLDASASHAVKLQPSTN